MSAKLDRTRSAWELISAKTKGRATPISAMLEVADRCNENCLHCYQVQGEKGELSTAELKRAMDELADLGVLFLTLSGGEPLLRRDFLELVTYARSKQFAVKVYSNGLRIDEAMADALSERAVQEVQLSLYSHRADVHDMVTGVPNSFERCTRAAKLLVERKIHVLLKTPLMRRINAHEQEEYAAYAASIGASYSFDPHVDARENGERDPEALRLEPDDAMRVATSGMGDRPHETTLREKSLEQSLCGACSAYVHVEPNGELRPCTLLPVAVGHIDDGIANAWNENETARDIRGLSWTDLRGCRDCDLQPYCARCFANARTEVGHALSPYPGACARAVSNYRLLRRLEITAPREVGPYVANQDGSLKALPLRLTDADRTRDAAQTWVSANVVDKPELPTDPKLVQIKRPKRAAETLRLPNSPNEST